MLGAFFISGTRIPAIERAVTSLLILKWRLFLFPEAAFAEDTRHMIIFDVLTNDSPVGWKGERTRLFLSDTGYEKALDSQEKGQIKILSHAKVRQGNLHYDRSDQLR